MLHISYLYRIHAVTFLPFRAYNTDNQLIIDTILGFVNKQYFVFLHHLILGDAMTKLGKRVLPRYYNNIATLPQLHCRSVATTYI